MDDSMSSTNYMINQSFSSTPDNSSEESGWTFYFEDFLANNNNHNMDTDEDYIAYTSSGYQNSSMVSDAAAMRKHGSSKKVSKNRKITAKTFVDEDLEDTASSPGHSPKVLLLFTLSSSLFLCSSCIFLSNFSKNKFFSKPVR